MNSPLDSLMGNLDFAGATEGQRVGAKQGAQFVKFYTVKEVELIPRGEKTNELGKKVTEFETKEVERLKITVVNPDDRYNIKDDYAEEQDIQLHWGAYEAFRKGLTFEGKSIEECSYIPAHITNELRYKGIHSEEQFARVSDEFCASFPELQNLREIARAHQRAKEGNKIADDISTMKLELKKYQDMVAELQSRLDSSPSTASKSKSKKEIKEIEVSQ